MNALQTELRAVAEAVERPVPGAAAVTDAAVARSGRLGSLAGWWSGAHPSGPPSSAAVAWAGPGWDDVPVPHLVPVRAAEAPTAEDDVVSTFHAGVAAADALVDGGVDVVVVHVDAAGPARRLVCTMLSLDATEAFAFPRSVAGQVVPTDREWIEHVALLRDDLRGLRPFAGRPGEVLTALDEPLLVAGTALVLQLAVRRTPMLLAGLGSLACASLVRRIAPAALTWWQIADTVDDPLHARLVAGMSLTPLLALDAGRDALLSGRTALGVLETAAALAEAHRPSPVGHDA